MGSKSPENGRRNGDETDRKPAPDHCPDPQSCGRGNIDANGQSGKSGDMDGGDDEGDDAEGRPSQPGPGLSATQESKKKKNEKSKRKKSPNTQTSPPTIPVSRIFPNGCTEGQLMPYENTARTTESELQCNSDRWEEDFLKDYREAAEIHRQVRQYAQQIISPGVSLTSIADVIETGVRNLCNHQAQETGDALKAGMGFPTGLCLNEIAAHYTPNPGDKDIIIQPKDILKVDFGVHVNGRIVDSAFTVAWDPMHDKLVQAVRAATETGIKEAGIDARVSHIGTEIQEVMESYEVEVDGTVKPVRAIRNITGHNILRYQIHGGKQVPFIKNKCRDRMEEGEVFAIETFGSTGKGVLRDGVGIYGYSRNPGVSTAHLSSASAKALLKTIDQNFGTLPFSRRYLERLGVERYHFAMKSLVNQGIVESYAPLVDIRGSYTAQFEHTILLHNTGKEVISRGNDY